MNFLNHFSRILNRWLARRPWRIFILCLPALLAILATVTVAAIVLRRPSSELYQRYDRLAQHSLARQQFETARVACLRGLAFAKNERNRAPWVFHLALALDGLGQKQDAAALMAEAAPLDPPGSGYVEAHLVVAENLLSTTNLVATTVRLADLKATNQVAQTLRLAERHLLSALKLDSNSVPVNEALGRFYINTHQLAKARERLTKIYAAKPDNALLLAIIADQQNDAPAAAQWADRAVTAIEQNILNSAWPWCRPC
jgi:tetratricopeptide (TPR) repeat protein